MQVVKNTCKHIKLNTGNIIPLNAKKNPHSNKYWKYKQIKGKICKPKYWILNDSLGQHPEEIEGILWLKLIWSASNGQPLQPEYEQDLIQRNLTWNMVREEDCLAKRYKLSSLRLLTAEWLYWKRVEILPSGDKRPSDSPWTSKNDYAEWKEYNSGDISNGMEKEIGVTQEIIVDLFTRLKLKQ